MEDVPGGLLLLFLCLVIAVHSTAFWFLLRIWRMRRRDLPITSFRFRALAPVVGPVFGAQAFACWRGPASAVVTDGVGEASNEGKSPPPLELERILRRLSVPI